MSSVAHVPTQALVAAFGENWLEVLAAASPQANFDNIIKTRKPSAPKLSPAQRAAQPFDTAKCHARVISEARDENGAPIYKKSGSIHPGFIDMQCRSSPTDGSCFCKKHSATQGGTGNLGKFSDPRPQLIKFDNFPNDTWLWSDDPQCEQYRRSDDDKTTKKTKTKTTPKKKKSDIVFQEQSWSVLANDPKLKKDLALCYLNHHKIDIHDPLGKVFSVKTLRGLVKKHYDDNPEASYTENTQENNDDTTEEEKTPENNDDTVQEDNQENTPKDEENPQEDDNPQDDEILQNDDSSPQSADEEDDEDDDTDKHIVYEGVEYKVDGFNDVFNIKDCYHMGVLAKEDPIKIEWASKEAKFLHFEAKEELDDL